ncbi:MAG TPA: hypothetical protein VGM37_19785 [Armatimonadota bacterium]|jgi:hypothetical protein
MEPRVETPPAAADPHNLNIKQLRDLCAVWQKRLRLQDWLVAVDIAPHWRLNPHTEMCCDATLSRKTALIEIIEPGHLSPGPRWPTDMGQTLIHELLHLPFAPFEAWRDTPADIAQGQAIDLLASSARLRRGLRASRSSPPLSGGRLCTASRSRSTACMSAEPASGVRVIGAPALQSR